MRWKKKEKEDKKGKEKEEKKGKEGEEKEGKGEMEWRDSDDFLSRATIYHISEAVGEISGTRGKFSALRK